ncbi:MAG: MgtC/SapB family protein [Schwartzia sp.]|nr:MgtC/SapB family protein [Schwartzia sp. (in: firmicutes)]
MRLEEIFGRLLLSCILGGVIGYEREARHKSAGLRTNLLVCLGSCLVMLISVDLGRDTGVDAARIAAQVVSGIGFLGAGAIMKEGLSVTGLTTAACLWVVAGVGLATGLGFYVGALLTTAFVFLVLRVFGRYDSWMVREDNFAVAVVAENSPGVIRSVTELLEAQDYFLRGIRIHMRESEYSKRSEPVLELEVEVSSKSRIDRGEVMEMIRGMEGVIKAEALN